MPHTPVHRPAAPVSHGKKRMPAEEMAASLSRREHQILSMLADGASGSEIAEALVLSPDTVRTHIRNAMSKLGASSRAQAVAIALRRGELEQYCAAPPDANPDAVQQVAAGGHSSTSISPGSADSVFKALLGALVAFPDIEDGAVFLVEEDGLAMRRVALVGDVAERRGSGRTVRLGEGPAGRAALEREPQLVQGDGPPGALAGRATMHAPMVVGGRVLGVISLTTRPSRLTARSDLLLLHGLAGRVGEILLSNRPDRAARLRGAFERLRTAWTTPTQDPAPA
jgi:DNA-binding CsgD family transcriptional regulator